MKNWKTWVLLLGIYLLVKTCGGCSGCSGCSSCGGVPKPNLRDLYEEVCYKTGFKSYEIEITNLELSVEDPPIYSYTVRLPNGIKKEGTCSVYSNGSIKNVTLSGVDY